MHLMASVRVNPCLQIVGIILCVCFLYRLRSAYLFFHNFPDAFEPALEAGGKICSKQLPSAFLIGDSSSGLTTLAKFLEQHSQISFCHTHTAFFTDNYSEGLFWYQNQMPCSFKGQVVMEQSDYFQDSRVPPRIWHMDQHVKLVVIVRNPIDRVNIAHSQRKTNRSFPFEKAVIHPVSNKVLENHKDIKTSLYDIHIQYWLNHFNHGDIHVVDADVFMRSPLIELSAVEAFLGIEPFFQQEQFVFNTTFGQFCLHDKGAYKCMDDPVGGQVAKISSSGRTILEKFFKPHNERFSELLNMAFAWT